jgi:hypothetical protein
MTEMKTWHTAGNGYGIEIGRDEPSHIHLPRRRRRVRPDGQGTSPSWPADVGDEEVRPQAQSFSAEA